MDTRFWSLGSSLSTISGYLLIFNWDSNNVVVKYFSVILVEPNILYNFKRVLVCHLSFNNQSFLRFSLIAMLPVDLA